MTHCHNPNYQPGRVEVGQAACINAANLRGVLSSVASPAPILEAWARSCHDRPVGDLTRIQAAVLLLDPAPTLIYPLPLLLPLPILPL